MSLLPNFKSHPTTEDLAYYVDRGLRGGETTPKVTRVANHVKRCVICARLTNEITAEWDEGDE
jgi:hypothetical protein